MVFFVVLPAQPADVQRIVIKVVVRFDFGSGANFAGLAGKRAVLQCAVNDSVSASGVRVSAFPFGNGAAVSGGAGSRRDHSSRFDL